MDIAYFEALEKELEGIAPFHRVAFAASCCERLLPNYSVFSRESSWGNPSILRVALDEVWQILQGKALDEPKINQLMDDCSNVAPNADDPFDSYYLPEAQVAVIAIANTLYLCLDPTPERTIGVAMQVEETLFSFISLVTDLKIPSSGDKKTLRQQREEVYAHPFTVREMAKQSEDLQRLKKVETLDQYFIKWLRTSSSNNGKSLVDLS